MKKGSSSSKTFYFSTRDLLIMAVLAALGGVTSTYVNNLGNAVRAILGFPGGTQWAAGLHTIWIVLAMGILRKTGTGTAIGILKGVVELMSGNSHGVIILLINLVAGLLVDFGFLVFKNKPSLPAYVLAGALSAGSNVIIFQLFATLPINILAVSAILILTLAASISGVIFSGVAPFYIVNALIKANVVKVRQQVVENRRVGWYVLLGVFVLASLLTVYLQSVLRGSPTIQISGAIEKPIEFSSQAVPVDLVTRQMLYRGVTTEYTGVLLQDVVDYTQPLPSADTLLIEASDGYAFLISLDELRSNPNILVVQKGHGQKTSYDLVGPESSKAWVRNVVKITVSTAQGLPIISPSGETQLFEPENWLDAMDSTQVALPGGSQKLQGVPLWKVIDALRLPEAPQAVRAHSHQESRSFAWQEVSGDDGLRIFTIIADDGFAYVLGTMSGEVLLHPLTTIEVE